MHTLLDILLFVHLLGMATLIGAFFVQWRAPEKLTPLWFWGALVQVVTGIAMLGLIDGAGLYHGGPMSTSGHIKLGVKLIVLIVIAILALIGHKRPAKVKPLGITMGALVVLNVGIAVFW